MIPFVNLVEQRKKYCDEFQKAEQTVLNSGCFIGGPQVNALENELAKYLGIQASNVITCASGTDAITIALMALELKPGDEVIVPDFTFIAPAECVALLGGVPKFADIDAQTLQISPESVQKLITKRTKGIIAVDLFGQCAPFYALKDLAKTNKLWLIEDAAQAFGAKQGKNFACTLGDISITSFYPTKPLGCYGDGGAIFTKNIELATRARQIANHGSKMRYCHDCIGINSRLDALQAAILCVKLLHLNEELIIRQKNATLYNNFFYNNCNDIIPQKIASNNISTYAQYTVLAKNRETFINKLEQANIPYCIHYPTPLHTQKCFEKYANLQNLEQIKNTIWATLHAISLPVCAFTHVHKIIDLLQ